MRASLTSLAIAATSDWMRVASTAGVLAPASTPETSRRSCTSVCARIAATVALSLSITRAGAELHLTQSAVSRQILDLEHQLGVKLFHRRHRALALTEAGQQLYPAAAQILAIMQIGRAHV